MTSKHKRVIGDRPGERVDKAYKAKVNEKHPYTLGGCSCEYNLLRSMEQHAYAITGKLFSQTRSDVVNEALTRAWQGMGKFQGRSRFSTWFHRIVVNVSKAHGAKETLRKSREVPLTEMIEGSYNGTMPEMKIVLASCLTAEELMFLYDKTLHALPDAEVAIKWGLSLSGVRGKWHRIKRKIQAALE